MLYTLHETMGPKLFCTMALPLAGEMYTECGRENVQGERKDKPEWCRDFAKLT